MSDLKLKVPECIPKDKYIQFESNSVYVDSDIFLSIHTSESQPIYAEAVAGYLASCIVRGRGYPLEQKIEAPSWIPDGDVWVDFGPVATKIHITNSRVWIRVSHVRHDALFVIEQDREIATYLAAHINRDRGL